jgi:hypothetical protein
MDIWNNALRWGEAGKNWSNIQQSWWSSGSSGFLLSQSGTWEFGWENLHVEMKMVPCMEECNSAPSIEGNLAFEFLQCISLNQKVWYVKFLILHENETQYSLTSWPTRQPLFQTVF